MSGPEKTKTHLRACVMHFLTILELRHFALCIDFSENIQEHGSSAFSASPSSTHLSNGAPENVYTCPCLSLFRSLVVGNHAYWSVAWLNCADLLFGLSGMQILDLLPFFRYQPKKTKADHGFKCCYAFSSELQKNLINDR